MKIIIDAAWETLMAATCPKVRFGDEANCTVSVKV
jgi:hypothetical protein